MNNRPWKTFVIGDVFEIHTGASISQAYFKEGDIPRITATDINNGIGIFTNNIKHKNLREVENFISYSFLGSSFYHSYRASLDMKIHSLKIKDRELNQYLGLFIVTCLKNSIPRPSYGNQISSKDILTKKVMLPATECGEPDWDFMEEYIRIKLNQVKANYKYPKLNDITDDRELYDVDWKEYLLKDVFPIVQRGKRLVKTNQSLGMVPYISSTMFSNGVAAFIGNKKGVREFENCLTIANSGSVGSVFFHKYKFIASDHVTALKNELFTENQYKFIAICMKGISEKYSFNREINDQRISKERILLPTKNNTIDLEFMEQYMKRMENRVLEKVKNRF